MSDEEFREDSQESSEVTKLQREIEKSGAKTIGEYLSFIRQKMGLSVEDLDRVSRIGPRWIDAIESGEWSTYPSLIYAKGHIKGYATVLGLDGSALIEQFHSELEQAFPDEKFHVHPVQNINQIYQPTSHRKERTIGNRIIFMAVLAVLFLVFLISRLLHHHGEQQASFIPAPVPNPGILTPENHPGAKTIPPGSTTLAPSSGNTGSSQPEQAPNPQVSNHPLSTSTTPNNVGSPSDSPTIKPSTGVNPSKGSNNLAKAARPVDYVLKVVALRDTWIGISTDGKRNINIPLDQGQWRIFHGKQNFRISTDDGGSLMLYLGKNKLGKAGEDDQPVKDRLIKLTSNTSSIH
ncbi:MAG: helix-turn-helix domain-containing protein [Leptospirales bacterium]